MTLRDDDLDPTVAPAEREALSRIVVELQRARPVPGARFRGDLRRRLVSDDASSGAGAHRRRRLGIASLVTGAALLMLAAAGVADLGPLAPAAPDQAVAWILSAV